MRKEYEMTENQFKLIMEASKPVPYLVFNGIEPESPQENANRAWRNLGDELGFDYMTVEPSEKGERFFTADPKSVRPATFWNSVKLWFHCLTRWHREVYYYQHPIGKNLWCADCDYLP